MKLVSDFLLAASLIVFLAVAGLLAAAAFDVLPNKISYLMVPSVALGFCTITTIGGLIARYLNFSREKRNLHG